MFNKSSLSTIKNVFFIGLSAFLVGTGYSLLAPKSLASPGFLEFQWDPDPDYRRLRYYLSNNDTLARANYYLFLRGKERENNIIKLTFKIPNSFDAKIKSEKLTFCKVKVGGYTGRTKCLEKVPSLIEVNDNQASIDIFPKVPIPRDKNTYALKMKIFNPRKSGMYQIQTLAQSQQPGEIPVSRYLGTYNITVQKNVQ